MVQKLQNTQVQMFIIDMFTGTEANKILKKYQMPVLHLGDICFS